MVVPLLLDGTSVGRGGGVGGTRSTGPLSDQMLEQWVLGPFNFMRVEGVNRCVPLHPLDDRGIDAIDSPSNLNPIIVYRHITQQTVQELTDGNQVLRAPPGGRAIFF